MTCNLDLESLISDNNRSIATLAITTLLKTGAESSIERLMKQIATFVNEITDEFKIVVVNAIKSLCLKFPQKNVLLVNFLSTMLRDEGGPAYKTCITDTIMEIINENPEVKDNALSHLCEFIEDCEHTNLAVRVIHFIGMEGPQTSNPAQYIRYIYNRYVHNSKPHTKNQFDPNTTYDFFSGLSLKTLKSDLLRYLLWQNLEHCAMNYCQTYLYF